jgi:NAD(P)H dehydrogenase (quinone)
VRVLVIQAHPSANGLSAALLVATTDGLTVGGHEFRVHRLYQQGFAADMSPAEHAAYHSDTPIISDEIRTHVADLQWAEALVFIYPTWWAGLPATLKGWLERVMVPGVAFVFDPATDKVAPNLRHIRRIVGISTYGSPRWAVWLVADGGRRTLHRALRMICSRRTRRTWLGLYRVDGATDANRAAFLARVAKAMAAL